MPRNQPDTSPKIPMTPGPPNAYGDHFAAITRWSCGHDAQLPREWTKMAAMYGEAKRRESARLKCTKCGRRAARVEVYRVAG